jgi:hypothetical protein
LLFAAGILCLFAEPLHLASGLVFLVAAAALQSALERRPADTKKNPIGQ